MQIPGVRRRATFDMWLQVGVTQIPGVHRCADRGSGT